MMQGEKNIKI